MNESSFEMAAPAHSPPDNARQVAVVIAAWRAADTIGRAVASALAQPQVCEVVVADDASGDQGATVAAAQAADDGTGRLKLIALAENGGPARARNAAIAASTAPWIAILDSDDFFLPGRLAPMLARASEADLVADDITQVGEGQDPATGQRLIFRDNGAPRSGGVDAASTVSLSLEAFIRGNIPDPRRPRGELGFIKPILSRAFLDRHAIRYAEDMRLGEDYDLYARMFAARARGLLLRESGYVGVLRAGSLSDTRRRTDLENFRRADDRLLAQPALSVTERGLIRRHRHTIARVIVWIDFIDALKRSQVAKAAGVLARYPAGTPYVLGHLRAIAAKRLSMRTL
jgi:succinoglycan biosynthesis protein ExoU